MKKLLFLSVLGGWMVISGAQPQELDYERARWDPIHFPPQIDNATDFRCLQCHGEILERRVHDSPAGVKPSEVLAWYQTLDTYKGSQETFHRRHLLTPYAREVMDLRCNFCHRGHDPREEAPIPPSNDAPFTLRKVVHPEKTCLLCHGAFPYQRMGLPGPWPEVRDSFNNDCLSCHATIRTERHQVSYLHKDNIERLAKEKGGDVCYGCHGGRAWYRIAYPYSKKKVAVQNQSSPVSSKEVAQ